MLINFILWSPLISLLSVALLYPLRLHARNLGYIRLWAAIFLLPALFSSFCTLKLIYYDGVNLVKVFMFVPTPLNGIIGD